MSNMYTQFSTLVPWQEAARAALLEKLRTPEDPDRSSPPCEFEE